MQPEGTQGHGDAPNPALIFDMLNAHQRTAVLKTALELDVFRAVGEGPGDVASIAKKCGASERGIRVLCDMLTMNGLLKKQDGMYLHTPTSAVLLDTRSPASMASVALFIGNESMMEPTRRLTEVVRNGRTILPGEGTVEDDNPMWVSFAENMMPMMGPGSGPMAEMVMAGKTGPVEVLDIAAGHGLFGIAFAQKNPEAHVTALDWANVLEVAKRNAAAAGVGDRYKTIVGSAFDVDMGGPYDVVLLTNFLHHFNHATCVELLKKVRAVMKPGGRVATLEFVPNEDRISPPQSAGFSLVMLLTTPEGDAYTLRELTAMYEEAGFRDVAAQALPMSPETVVMGTA